MTDWSQRISMARGDLYLMIEQDAKRARRAGYLAGEDFGLKVGLIVGSLLGLVLGALIWL